MDEVVWAMPAKVLRDCAHLFGYLVGKELSPETIVGSSHVYEHEDGYRVRILLEDRAPFGPRGHRRARDADKGSGPFECEPPTLDDVGMKEFDPDTLPAWVYERVGIPRVQVAIKVLAYMLMVTRGSMHSHPVVKLVAAIMYPHKAPKWGYKEFESIFRYEPVQDMLAEEIAKLALDHIGITPKDVLQKYQKLMKRAERDKGWAKEKQINDKYAAILGLTAPTRGNPASQRRSRLREVPKLPAHSAQLDENGNLDYGKVLANIERHRSDKGASN